jgi:ribosomal protein S6E (S10)
LADTRLCVIDAPVSPAHSSGTAVIESPVFARQREALLSEEEYMAIVDELVSNPTAGDVIRDTGGLCKLRVARGGKGKRGGGSVIYFHVAANSQLRMLLVYAKGVKDDLSAAERKVLRALNEAW